MLSEYKQACYDNASLIPNWKQIDKNELCRKYVEEKSKGNKELADSYLSAILYKFWNVTEHNYYSQSYKKATEGDCIDWTITGILYALNHHVWDDKNNILFNDLKGPEKAINICIYSTKVNFYQRIKHQKEKISYETLSLEQLMEDSSDSYYTPCVDSDNTVDNYISELIKKSFDNKDFLKAFVLDGIINLDVFDTINESDGIYTVFNSKKLRKHLRILNKGYCKLFAKRYNIDVGSVEDSAQLITDLDYSRLSVRVNNVLKSLKYDKNLIAYLVR